MLRPVRSTWLVAVFVSFCALQMLAGIASAGNLVHAQSVLKLTLGGLPPIVVAGSPPGSATLSNNGAEHDLAELSDIWNTVGNAVPASWLAGTPLVTGLTLTAANKAGSYTMSFGGSIPNPVGGNLISGYTPSSGTICPSGCLGGWGPMVGQVQLGLLGFPIAVPLAIVGGGGTAAIPIGPAATIFVTGAPWITGAVRMTNITTNVIWLPARGPIDGFGVAITLEPNTTEEIRTITQQSGFLSTNPNGLIKTRTAVTLSGTNNLLSASQTGQVTLVSPIRFQAGPLGAGSMPGKFEKTFTFVPEPSSALLLLSGVAGLCFIGRKRMKR